MKKSIENTDVGWGFWLQWVLASIIGVTIGKVISQILIANKVYLLQGLELYIIQGSSIGIMQWLILRNKIPKSGWWIITTTIGFGFGFRVSAWPPDLTNLQYVFAWAIAGFIQWLYLRKKVSRAGWWIPATTLALSMAVIYNMGLQWKFPYEIVNSLGFGGISPRGYSFHVTMNSPAAQALPLVEMGISLILWYLAEAFMGMVLTWQLRHISKKQPAAQGTLG